MDRFYRGINNSCSSNSGYTNDDFFNGYDNCNDICGCRGNNGNTYTGEDTDLNSSNYTAVNGNTGCSIINTATAKGYYYASAASDPTYVTAEDTITLGCIMADIDKSADRDTVAPGDIIRYTITFRNMSAKEMYNVKITDQLSTYLNVIATSITPFPQGNESLDTGINIGRVAPGASKTLTFAATVTDDVSEDIVNRAFADFNFRDADGREQSASTPITSVTTTVENTGITITKTADKNYVTSNGEYVEFTITVTNSSSRGISDLVITDNLPSNLKYVEDTTSINGDNPIDADPTGGIYIGELKSGASVTVKFTAAVNL